MANDELERFRLNFSRYAHSDMAPLNSNYPSKKHKMSVVQPDEFFFFFHRCYSVIGYLSASA